MMALMQRILKKDLQNSNVSEYVRSLFEYFVINVSEVSIDFYWLDEYFSGMRGVFAAEGTESAVMMEQMVALFPNCARLQIANGHQGVEVSEGYLQGLLKGLSAVKKEGKGELKEVEIRDAKFESAMVFGQFMEPFFNAGWDVNIEKKKYEKSLVFKAVEE